MTSYDENRSRFLELAGRPFRLLLGGTLSAASDGGTYPVVEPSTGDVAAEVPLATPADVASAVDAATKAWPAWADSGPSARAATLRAMVEAVRRHADDLAILDAGSSGNPIRWARGGVTAACDRMVPSLIELSTAMFGSSTRGDGAGSLHLTLREPYGVVARLTAFNHPLNFALTRIVAPLMAGNAVVLKVAEQDPLGPLLLGEIVQDVFPPGVLSILSGDGVGTGAALVADPRIKRIALTGSRATGLAIQRAAAEVGVRHVTLELGGKNALVVLPGADVDRTADIAVAGMNLKSQGQSCGSTSRIYLHESLHDDVVAAMAARLADAKVGPSLDPATEMGPVVTAAHRDRVVGFVDRAVAEGAHVAAGGHAIDGPGWFVEPTLLTAEDDDREIVREEVFGPVAVALPWRDTDEVLARVNASNYGLTAAVVGAVGPALALAQRIDAGYVWVNGSSRHELGLPFGGWKDSGVGTEEGRDEAESFTQVKTINLLEDPG